MLGPDELQNGLVAVKNLSSGEQTTVMRGTVADIVRGMLKG